MFEEFSSGYYLGRLYVEPHDSDVPVLHENLHRSIGEKLYDGTEGIEPSVSNDGEKPVVIKLGNRHLVVEGGEVPSSTLGLPEDTIEEFDIRNPPSLKSVLLAKAEHAAKILSLRRFGFGSGSTES
ncbi:MAG: DUF5802 family protein [Halobacteria archaeon]|nr:DUF5802 family protein [Halobacteria archaeon]